MVDIVDKREQKSNSPKIPSLSGDIRHLIPTLGLRNYWYPLIQDKKVPKRKPIKISLLGDDLAVFRNAEGSVVAVADICPHRGARLSEGHIHWPGYVSCPYHGWTFDETGKNVAVLSEGPGAAISGTSGTSAKKYPTNTLRGSVFVLVGEEEPAPIEEDVPEELFDETSLIICGTGSNDGYWS